MGGISAGVEGQDFTFLHIILLLKYQLWSAYFNVCIFIKSVNFKIKCKKTDQLINGILHELLNYNQCDRRWGVNQPFVLFVAVTAPLDSLVNNWSDAPIIDQIQRNCAKLISSICYNVTIMLWVIEVHVRKWWLTKCQVGFTTFIRSHFHIS